MYDKVDTDHILEMLNEEVEKPQYILKPHGNKYRWEIKFKRPTITVSYYQPNTDASYNTATAALVAAQSFATKNELK